MSHDIQDIPKVGIWFLFKGKLVAYAVPWNEGLEYGNCVNGPVDHVHYWENIRKHIPGAMDVEYDEIPRGRVLYNRTEGAYYSYGSQKFIGNQKLKNMVATEFGLPSPETKNLADDHYMR